MIPVFAQDEPLAELHAHLGGGVDAATMWELAHEQGIKLPYRDYWEFASATNVGGGTDGLDGLDRIYHLTELIQSSPEGVLRVLAPLALEYSVYRALLENQAGEYAARMTAMEAATRNTEELIRSLDLQFNRARQAAITRELVEIVSGAEAL